MKESEDSSLFARCARCLKLKLFCGIPPPAEPAVSEANKKNPLKSTDFRGFWSEWGDSNARSLEPKSSAIPTSLHPDIHFSAMIPRRGRKSKIILSVVIPVVKAAFVPFSATGGKPAIARAARLCGLLSKPRMDRVYALPKQARYQLRYTRLYIVGLSDRPHSIPYSAPVFKSFLHRQPQKV